MAAGNVRRRRETFAGGLRLQSQSTSIFFRFPPKSLKYLIVAPALSILSATAVVWPAASSQCQLGPRGRERPIVGAGPALWPTSQSAGQACSRRGRAGSANGAGSHGCSTTLPPSPSSPAAPPSPGHTAAHAAATYGRVSSLHGQAAWPSCASLLLRARVPTNALRCGAKRPGKYRNPRVPKLRAVPWLALGKRPSGRKAPATALHTARAVGRPT